MVTEIRIYAEGGGDGKDGKAAMRGGFGRFLAEIRKRARAHRIRWSIIACGGRNKTLDAFRIALEQHPDAFNVLLVDSESAVTSPPWRHLQQKDGWEQPGVDDAQCHLMVQEMEAWFLADLDALAGFYGAGFRRQAMPKTADVETIERGRLESSIKAATQDTRKGPYRKIQHGAELLRRIDPEKVRARAKHCGRLFDILEKTIDSAVF